MKKLMEIVRDVQQIVYLVLVDYAPNAEVEEQDCLVVMTVKLETMA
jgi:hypothetical protein